MLLVIIKTFNRREVRCRKLISFTCRKKRDENCESGTYEV